MFPSKLLWMFPLRNGWGLCEDVRCHFVCRNLMNWNSPILRLVPNEVKLCLDVLAPLVHDWVVAKSDTTLVVLSNCYWTFLLDAKILKKLFQIRVLPELLLPCPHILLLMKKEQQWPASWLLSWVLRHVRWAWSNSPLLIFFRSHLQTSLHHFPH